MPNAKPALSILVATDLSDGVHEALHSAIALAQATAGTLHVVHALDVTFPRSDRGRDIGAIQKEAQETRVALAKLLSREVPAGVKVETSRVKEGAPAEVILAEARAIDADVIVLGTHRRRAVADRFIGSTAERVLRESTIPCLLANAPLRLPIHRVVVPSDLTAPARRAVGAALDWAERLAPEGKAVVGVAHVLDGTSEADVPWVGHEVEVELRKSVRGTADEVGSQVTTEVSVLRGSDPALELLDYARSTDAQLIVMGTNSDPVLVRAVLGSVSSAMIRHSDLPILLVPSRVRAQPQPTPRTTKAPAAKPQMQL
ncbi:MAG TPA: universal stress protein [Longimicrobiaceae bacterium]|nr:universal stress protein [Longimicrobiaceae bacterium]